MTEILRDAISRLPPAPVVVQVGQTPGLDGSFAVFADAEHAVNNGLVWAAPPIDLLILERDVCREAFGDVVGTLGAHLSIGSYLYLVGWLAGAVLPVASFNDVDNRLWVPVRVEADESLYWCVGALGSP